MRSKTANSHHHHHRRQQQPLDVHTSVAYVCVCVCAQFACLPFLSLSWCLCSYYRPLSLSHISTTAFVSAVHVLVVIVIVVVVDVGSGSGGSAGVGLNSLSSFLLSFRVLQLKFVFSIVIFLRSFVRSFFLSLVANIVCAH